MSHIRPREPATVTDMPVVIPQPVAWELLAALRQIEHLTEQESAPILRNVYRIAALAVAGAESGGA